MHYHIVFGRVSPRVSENVGLVLYTACRSTQYGRSTEYGARGIYGVFTAEDSEQRMLWTENEGEGERGRA